MTHTTENEILVDTAIASTEPHRVEAGNLYVVPTSQGGRQVIDLTGDEYLDQPRRKTGRIYVRDVDSFAGYWSKHAAGDVSEVYADLDDDTITAVLDAHGVETAGWGRHRLIYQIPKTRNWLTWIGQSGNLMGQTTFAELLEANLPDIAEPAGADLVELAQTFSAKTEVQFRSGAILADGSRELIYSEEIQASGGRGKTIVIPKQITLVLSPYEGSPPRTITARFRYRIKDGDLRLGYVLDQPADHLAEAFDDIVAQVDNAISGTILRGRPA